MKVHILTEGGKDIGFGHITRCISLVEAFKRKGIMPVLIINGDETIKKSTEGQKFESLDWIKEKENLFRKIESSEIVIIDSLKSSLDLNNKIASIVPIPVFIDDFRMMNYTHGFVIDWTIFAEKRNRKRVRTTKYLLGHEYVALRSVFWQMKRKTINQHVKSMMVTFGGEDLRGMTVRILKILIDHYPDVTKKVIVGRSFKNIKSIGAMKNNNIQLIYYPDGYTMKEIMLNTEICIAAGGQTLYELARAGVPTVAILIADNQIYDIAGWKKAGFIKYAGAWDNINLQKNIIKSVEELMNYDERFRRSQIGRKYVDGLGASRIIEAILKDTSFKSG